MRYLPRKMIREGDISLKKVMLLCMSCLSNIHTHAALSLGWALGQLA